MNLIFGVDTSLFEWINGLAGHIHAADIFMVLTAKYMPVLLILILGALWFTMQKKYQLGALLAALSAVLALGIGQIIGFIFHRLRPYYVHPTHLLIARTQDTSFPSDHATLAFAIAALIWQIDRKISIVLLVLAALLGFARIYVGTHYPTDVIGGAILGIVVSSVVVNLSRQNVLEAWIDRLFLLLSRWHLAAYEEK